MDRIDVAYIIEYRTFMIFFFEKLPQLERFSSQKYSPLKKKLQNFFK